MSMYRHKRASCLFTLLRIFHTYRYPYLHRLAMHNYYLKCHCTLIQHNERLLASHHAVVSVSLKYIYQYLPVSIYLSVSIYQYLSVSISSVVSVSLEYQYLLNMLYQYLSVLSVSLCCISISRVLYFCVHNIYRQWLRYIDITYGAFILNNYSMVHAIYFCL